MKRLSGSKFRVVELTVVVLGLLLGTVAATAIAGEPGEVAPIDDEVGKVADFAGEFTIAIDHIGHYKWESPVRSAATDADAFVLEPRYVDAEVENAQLTPVSTESGTYLIYEFDVVKFSEGAHVVIFDVHADGKVATSETDAAE